MIAIDSDELLPTPERINLLRLRPGDFIWVKTPDDYTNDRTDEISEAWRTFLDGLGHKDVGVVVTRKSEIFRIKEETLNLYGYFRKEEKRGYEFL